MQLTRNGVAGTVEVEPLAYEFGQLHTFRLRNLIAPELMKLLQERIAKSGWETKGHQGIGVEVIPEDPLPINILNFAANAPAFLDVVRRITGYGEIIGFGGRVYRLATSEHYDSWHDDLAGESRLVGMSVNLSPVPYDGGVFRLRARGTEDVLRELPNTGLGDAIFFRISPELQHMVTPIIGAAPKTAFAGWFGADMSFRSKVLASER